MRSQILAGDAPLFNAGWSGWGLWDNCDELKDWAVATMVKFYNVLKPKLDDYFRSA
ncbi:MAG: hypothetical protein ACXQTW_00330 [Candidatus Methanospirareceae archaeon]